MPIRKLTNRARAFAAGGAAFTTLLGFAIAAPVANADVYSSYTLSVAAEGTQPTAPRFFEGFSNTINVAGSETAEYALEQVGPVQQCGDLRLQPERRQAHLQYEQRSAAFD